MTSAQQSTNGHRVSPPSCSVENPAAFNSAHLPTEQDHKDSQPLKSQILDLSSDAAAPFPASAYHVPPKLYAPKADSFHDTVPDGLRTMKMPDRCQFMFSDGRQCTMARSDIHPSLCFYHADREEQLFGDPSCRCEARTLDFPELYSVSRDLSTAAGVNRALAQVFRMLAQRRISRQEAATFAKLAHLLLQSIRAAQAEADSVRAETAAFAEDRLSVIPVIEREKAVVDTALLPNEDVTSDGRASTKPAPSFRATNWSEESVSSPPISQGSRPHCTPASRDVSSSNNSQRMNTSESAPPNSREINTSENIGFEPIQNQHLHEVRRERHGHQELRGVNKVGAFVAQVAPSACPERCPAKAHSRRAI